MKRIFYFTVLALLFGACSSINKYSYKKYNKYFFKKSTYDVTGETPSPFIGRWSWLLNEAGYQSFSICIDAEGDSLLIGMGGVFYGGNRIDIYDYDETVVIPDLVVPTPTSGNRIDGKIHALRLNLYGKEEEVVKRGYKNISFELLDNNTMIYRVEDNRRLIPDSAVLRRSEEPPYRFSKERFSIYRYLPDYTE